jgi:HK97 family phage portal protein
MNMLERLRRWIAPRASFDDDDADLVVAGGKKANASGLLLTGDAPLTISAVWSAVRIISEAMGSMPVQVIERRGDRRDALDNHPAALLLSVSPDEEISGVDFIETAVSHALLWGNGYASIRRELNGAPRALQLLQPHRVKVKRTESGELVYEVRDDYGYTDTVPAADMLHFRGLGYDGLVGYSVVTYARQSFGMSSAMETFGASFFGNGTAPAGVLSTEAKLDQVTIESMRRQWEEVHKGSRKANKTAILGGGLKWTPMTMPMTDAQFLESRRFQILEISRWFRVPPHMLGELERATHTNVEQMAIDFVGNCLLPWVRRFESECNLKLLGRNQRAFQRVRFNMSGLLRGDLKSRYEAYAIGRQNGWLSANDVRRLEDMNPIPGGDDYHVQTNLAPMELLRDKVEAEIEKIEKPVPNSPPADPAAPASPEAPTAGGPEARIADAARRLQLVIGVNHA